MFNKDIEYKFQNFKIVLDIWKMGQRMLNMISNSPQKNTNV